MKKITLVVMAIFLSMAFYPAQTNAANTKKDVTPTSLSVTPKGETAETKAMLKRIDEIGKMDKTGLKASEKQELRKEVRSIKKQLAADGGYIYISVGTAILIVILLIILL